MTRILLATDLTPYGDRALDRAVLLAQTPPGALTLLHVTSDELLSGTRAAAAQAAGETALARHVAEAALPATLNVTMMVRSGEPGAAIVTAAQDDSSGLVVLGATHADLLVRLFRPNVLFHVVRHAPCPVLVVRRRGRAAYRRVVVATDLSQPSREALAFALRFVPGGEFTLVHARTAAEPGTPDPMEEDARLQLDDMVTAALSRLAAEGGAAPASITTTIAAGAAGVVVGAAAAQADVAVMGTLGLTGAANLLLGSTAERLVDTLPCDVITVRRP